MADPSRAESGAAADIHVKSFIQQVYGWMAAALAVTGFVALGVSRSARLQQLIFDNPMVLIGLIIGELVLVIFLARRLHLMTPQAATTAFIGYSVLNGITLSFVFLAYTQGTIARAFFVTAGVFAIMTVYGFATKTDLTRIGNMLGMALLGFVIASVVNLFLRSETFYWIITYAGVVLFVGLIAYDSQRIKELALAGFEDEGSERKTAIMGALRIYLDFINLFVLLLRITGRRR